MAMQLAGIPADERGYFTNSHFNALSQKICQETHPAWKLDPRTYRRFWSGEPFEQTDARKVLSAYVLIRKGLLSLSEITLRRQKDGRETIPSIDYWPQLQAALKADAQPQAVKSSPPPICSKRYSVLFFSHVRYDIWDKGYIELDYHQPNSGQARGAGFYRNNENLLTGTFELVGNHLCIDLQLQQPGAAAGWLKILGKVDGARMAEAPYFRAACITVSSYSQQYISAVEMIFLDDRYAHNEAELRRARRYLMLQRHRFRSEVFSPADPLQLTPSGLQPNDLRNLPGNYLFIKRIRETIFVSVLTIDDDYRSCLRSCLGMEASSEKNYQLCYLELARGNTNYLAIRGYEARQHVDEPNLGCFVSTLTLPLRNYGSEPIRATFSSLVETDEQEYLWAGEAWLFRRAEQQLPAPLRSPYVQLPALLAAAEAPLAEALRAWQQHSGEI